MKLKTLINKKAQEETAGFVLIVIIVIIISIIILGIKIRQGNNNIGDSKNIHQFLESIMQYTTDCAIGYEPAYSKLGELINECNEGISRCTSGKEPCDVAKEVITNMVNVGFYVNNESLIKGYEFKSVYELNNTKENNKEIIFITKGECLGSEIGSELLTSAFPGTISNSLKLCY